MSHHLSLPHPNNFSSNLQFQFTSTKSEINKVTTSITINQEAVKPSSPSSLSHQIHGAQAHLNVATIARAQPSFTLAPTTPPPSPSPKHPSRRHPHDSVQGEPLFDLSPPPLSQPDAAPTPCHSRPLPHRTWNRPVAALRRTTAQSPIAKA
ncbi:hypothetical protein M0R45_006911 [Rubus argutus]|uniref:Uncharacterized protein n=1 Tax=Rubus argutus TaxID=59490 RepID=A0AAW1YRW2_RUBAR